jgi:hypothetical protein
MQPSGDPNMTTAEIRQQLASEIDRIPDDRLGEVFDVLHYFRLGLEASSRPSGHRRHRPSSRLAGQGARLNGDLMAPAIPLDDWGDLYRGEQ